MCLFNSNVSTNTVPQTLHFCFSIAKIANLDSVNTFSLGGNSLTSNLVFYHTQRFPTTIEKITSSNNIKNSECNNSD